MGLNALDLIQLTALMAITSGSPDIKVGVIDGPVATYLAEFSDRSISQASGRANGNCDASAGIACLHGTFVAGILAARRGSVAPAICPDCTLLIHPIFAEGTTSSDELPSATPDELAAVIIDCIGAGVRVLNISAAIGNPTVRSERALEAALDQAAKMGVIVVVASGNQGALGSTAITRHPWVIPVVGYDQKGRPMNQSNIGSSIGRRGLGAPGEQITSIGLDGSPLTLTGTSASTPFVTGTIALLWSVFPNAKASEMKISVTQSSGHRRATVIPPLLNAWAAYQNLKKVCGLQA